MSKRLYIEKTKKYLPYILLAGFIIFKIQDLFLPYFWDEAWSYIPAIKEMATRGPSLLPNSISPELYRGHPLLFYFISSVWIKIVGTDIWMARLLPLFISLCLLQSVFIFAKNHFDYYTAILTLFILIIQSVFFAQATFFLPEMLLALFTVLSLNSFLDKKYFQTIIWLTLALYTKESAIVIWGIISFWRFNELLNAKDRSILVRLKIFMYFLIPLILTLIFFLAQKLLLGWFFFPAHISYISFDAFFDRLNGYSSYLFIFMGRNLLTFFGLIALIILLIKKDKTIFEKHRILYILASFILAYLLFSSFNFYSPRYLLSILPFVILIWVYLLKSATRKYHIAFPILIFVVVIINNLHFTINKRGGHDHTLGYRDLINVQAKMVSYCEATGFYDKEIHTHFLMLNNLTNSDLGYLKSDRIFLNVKSNLTDKTEYAIFSSNELNKGQYESIKGKSILIKRYEQKGCWTELYRMENH